MLAIVLAAPLAQASEPPAGPHVRVIGKTHTIMASNDLSGPGSRVAGLAATYDMSLFEWNWGGRQSAFNGAGITTNANYPLTDGDAITTNDHLGVAAAFPGGLELGLIGQAYAAGGDRTVGRVFGEELPWNAFERRDGRVVQDRAAADLHQAWLRDREGSLRYDVTAGNLKDLDVTRTEHHFLKLGSLFFRPPVTNASFFEKEDRKLESGRHPLRGVDAVLETELAPDWRLHGAIFGGRTKPTPVQEFDRDSWGSRWAVDGERGGLGLTAVRSEGERNPSITGERQTLWGVDGAWRVAEGLDGYGAWGVDRVPPERPADRQRRRGRGARGRPAQGRGAAAISGPGREL